MIVCRQCGHQNADSETFCASCGKFLEWTGERVVVAEPEPEPPPPTQPEPEPARHGFIDRVKQAVGLDEEAAAQAPAAPGPAPRPVTIYSGAPNPNTPVASPPVPPPTAAPRAPYAQPPVPSTPPPSYAPPPPPIAPPAPAPYAAAPRPPGSGGTTPDARPAQVPWGPAPYAPTPPAVANSAPPASPATPAIPAPAPAAEPVSVYPDEPMSRRPVSVVPAAPRPRPKAEPPTRRQPGDLICGQCGEGNDPSRHFCRRCGNVLDEAVVVRLPWYRRFLNRVVGNRTREAGWRPRRIGPPNIIGAVWRIIRLAIAAAIVIGALAFFLVPSFHSYVIDRVTKGVTAIRILIAPHNDPIRPISVMASSSIAGHPAGNAIDTYSNTYWAAAATDHSPMLVFVFQEPEDLAKIGFVSGASGTAPADQFSAQPSPHHVRLVFSNGSSQDLYLVDSPIFQTYPIDDGKGVTKVQIYVLSTFANGGATSSVAISDVEFRIRD